MVNRDAKISLLVGLAFVIAVGILLSDHLSTVDEPTPARLPMAGRAVLTSLGDPTPVADAVAVPRTVTPTGPISTPAELATARDRRLAVEPVVTRTTTAIPDAAMAFVPTPTAAVPPSANPDLIATAARNGQPVVPVGTGRHPASPATAARAGTVWYTVKPGDTLWSIASTQLGTSSAVAAIRDLNRDALHGDRLRLNMRLRLPKAHAGPPAPRVASTED